MFLTVKMFDEYVPLAEPYNTFENSGRNMTLPPLIADDRHDRRHFTLILSKSSLVLVCGRTPRALIDTLSPKKDQTGMQSTS